MHWNDALLTLPMPCRHLRFTFVSHEMNRKSHGQDTTQQTQTRDTYLNHSAGMAGGMLRSRNRICGRAEETDSTKKTARGLLIHSGDTLNAESV